MALTLDENLKKGIEAHKSGNLQEADRYYTAVLKMQPEHPVANHNLGVIALSAGKPEQALQLFETALKSTDSVVQFWLSYMDALVGLNRFSEASNLLTRARESGLSDDALDRLENKLNPNPEMSAQSASPPQNQIDTLVSLYYSGQFDRAEKACQDLLDRFPQSITILNIQAAVFQKQGRFHEAFAALTLAIQLKPDFAEAYYNRGLALTGLGKPQDALHDYTQAIRIKPDYAEAWNNKAIVLADLDHPHEALACYAEAIRIKPDYAEAHNNRGKVLTDLGTPQEAIGDYTQAIRIKPDYATAYNNMAKAFSDLGRPQDAVTNYTQAIRIKPDYAAAYNNRGKVLTDLGKLQDALHDHNQAIRLKPDYAQAYNNRGKTLKELGRPLDALKDYDKAIQLKPDLIEAYNNRGTIFTDLGRYQDAIDTYGELLKLNPENALAKFNRSLVRLLCEDFSMGWSEYKWRFKARKRVVPEFGSVLWDGSPLDGKNLLVFDEQGLGDTIQFMRYLPMVREKAARIIFRTKPVFSQLFSQCRFIDHLWTPSDDSSPPPELPDAEVALLDLPGLFHTTLETIPGNTPYLSADPDLVSRFKEKIGDSEKLKAGIVWSGNPSHSNDRNRSCGLDFFLALSKRVNVQFYSLQKEITGKQANDLKQNGIPDLISRVQDLSETAAAIACLDLVISVDTAVAHLAGALNRNTWVLLPFSPDWRWMLDRDDSPWYPSVKLFRQPAAGDWETVFKHIQEALSELA